MRLLERACVVADDRPQDTEPTLAETAEVWAAEAQVKVDWAAEPIQAKRLAFAKFRATRRRAGPERTVTIPQATLEAVWWAALFTLVEAEGE